MPRLRLLIVDDDHEIVALIARIGADAGYEVATADSAETFMRSLQEAEPAVILLDLTMPGTDGIELLNHLAKAGSRARIIIVSGTDEGIRRMAYGIGVARGLKMAGVVAKPVRVAELGSMLTRLRLELTGPE